MTATIRTFTLLLAVCGLAACDEQGKPSAEKAGAAIDRAAEKTADTVGRTWEKAKEDGTVQRVQEGAKEAAHGVGKAMERTGEAITDTAERAKQ